MREVKQNIPSQDEAPGAGHLLSKTAPVTAPAANDPVHEAPIAAPPVARPDQRAKLAAAFEALGVGVDSQTAHQRSKQWFHASGAECTRALS